LFFPTPNYLILTENYPQLVKNNGKNLSFKWSILGKKQKKKSRKA